MDKKKILIVILIIMFFILIFSMKTYASSIDTNIKIDNSLSNQFDDMGATIISTVRIVGMIISVAGLIVMGIRYMMMSTEEKALEKESMILYCIGAALVFCIVNIVATIYDWMSTL